MTRAFQDDQIRQYLLGDLPAVQEEELEAAYFADSELLARVELAMDDLADEYAAARLSPVDRQKFERRVLATAEGREQLAITRAVRKAAGLADVQVQTPTWRVDRRWLSLAAVIPLAIGAAFFAWRLASGPDRQREGTVATGQTGGQPAPPGQVASPDATTSGRAPETAPRSGAQPGLPGLTLATLILTTDLERSTGQPPTLLVSSGATDVDLVTP